MIPAPLPENEYDRLAELHDLRLLDTGPDPRFDAITRLAQRFFNTPIAAFTLVDEDRQYFKSSIGLKVNETPRDQAFCAYAILGDDVFVVPDARRDERFHDNPLVTDDPDIAFYAGAPVHTDTGHTLGTLCVIDTVPRDWSPADSQALADLAHMVEQELLGSRQRARHEALVALTTITALKADDPVSLLSNALEIAREYLELPNGTITQWGAGGSTVLASVGSDERIRRGEPLPRAMSDVSPFHDSDDVIVLSADDPATRDHPLLESLRHVIGIRMAIDGVPFGTLSFTSNQALSYGHLTQEEADFVRLLGTWAEGVIDRWRQETALRQQRDLLGIISQIQSAFIGTSDRGKAFDRLLQDILALTGCEFGFITERHLTADGSPYLRTRAVSNIAWNEETRLLYERESARGLVFDNPNTLFGVTMVTGEVVIANDPANDPRSGTPPGGHPPLNSYMGMPLHLGTQFVGVLGLANHPGGFDEAYVEYLTPLATTLAQMISAARIQDERRADQQAIARLSTIATQMQSGVVVTDLDGRVEWTNESFTRMFGYSSYELIGLRPRDIFHGPQTSEATELGIREAMARREPFSAELEVSNRAAELFWVSLNSALLREPNGAPNGYVVLVDDITDRKRIERMKSEFISTVSHELRTPLTSISGSLGLVVSGVAGPLPERAERMITIALENSKRLTTLINDLLDLERMAEGGLPIESEPHDLMPIVERSIEDNQSYAAKYNCELVIQDRADGVRVHVDSVRLIQVLSNLLSNAAKFSPEGGRVVVDVRRKGGTVLLEIADRGPGLPESFRDHVFDRFAQADSSDTRQRGGSGLGLAISKELVERMDGTIGYRDNAGGGSVFWFTLPVLDEEPTAA